MKRARVESNVIQASSEVDGFEEISEADKEIIVNKIEEDKCERKEPFTVSHVKKRPAQAVTVSERRKKLKMMKVPSIKILFTNADQLTHAKKNELEQRIITEKPMLIAVSEVKPKNGREMSEADYGIDGYTINQVNKASGRGIIVYSHNSLDKSAIQIKLGNSFNEACLLEVRLLNGDTLLFGCIYRSPTHTKSSDENNEQLIKLIERIKVKKYSHVCLVGDCNYREFYEIVSYFNM